MDRINTGEEKVIDEEKATKVEELTDEEVIIEKPKEGLAVELGEVKELEEEIIIEVK